MGKLLITKEFKFSAAHKLTEYKGKCEKLHGHTYKLQVTVKGERKDDGLVIDFVELKRMVMENVVDKFDHAYLNDFFKNPTAENVAVWIWDELEGKFEEGVELEKVRLYESETSFVDYMGK